MPVEREHGQSATSVVSTANERAAHRLLPREAAYRPSEFEAATSSKSRDACGRSVDRLDSRFKFVQTNSYASTLFQQLVKAKVLKGDGSLQSQFPFLESNPNQRHGHKKGEGCDESKDEHFPLSTIASKGSVSCQRTGRQLHAEWTFEAR